MMTHIRPIAAVVACFLFSLAFPDGAAGEQAPPTTASAHVVEDGSRSARTFCFPARQHAYFINTFLLYHAYSGEAEWLQRAKDLGDWNLAHSTPADAAWANLPWAVW